ncbi:hypothetical protein, partial [uncultured Jatrophihabitans sp.]|uniref:hypothetical protein n=1 Tax=uncultured Jatrophihabitans sp. TaxID=1610747 RepID=UPI0035CB0D81
MSETLERADLTVALAAAHTAIDALQAGELASCTDEQVTALLRETERLRNRLETIDHVQILELERRGLALTAGA